MTRLASFDLDGTLLIGTTALKHVAPTLGITALVDSLVNAYERGSITNWQVADAISTTFSGRRPSDIWPLLHDTPMLEDARQGIEFLTARGTICIISTVTFKVFGEYFQQRLGALATSGIELETCADGTFSGKIVSHFDEHDKAQFVSAQCKRYKVLVSDAAHVGDSRSDIPTFKITGVSVALNGSIEAQRAATHRINTSSMSDLTAILAGEGF